MYLIKFEFMLNIGLFACIQLEKIIIFQVIFEFEAIALKRPVSFLLSDWEWSTVRNTLLVMQFVFRIFLPSYVEFVLRFFMKK